MFSTIDRNDDMMLTGAIRRGGELDSYRASSIKVLDDGWGELFVYGQEFGPMFVVRARTFCDAYDMVIDELPTIDPSEVDEAFYGDDLEEGYTFQSNATGTGIVNIGYYEWMREIQVEDGIVPIFTPY
jgi:hypothetical protein